MALPITRGAPSALGSRAGRHPGESRLRSRAGSRLANRPLEYRRAAVAAANVGHRHRQGPDRSRLVLHHGLAGHLSREPGIRARGQPARVLGSLRRRGPRELCRRRRVERAHRSRLARRRRAKRGDRRRHAHDADAHSRDLHDEARVHRRVPRGRHVWLRRVVDHDPQSAGGHLSQELRGVGEWDERDGRRHRDDHRDVSSRVSSRIGIRSNRCSWGAASFRSSRWWRCCCSSGTTARHPMVSSTESSRESRGL